jgi:hypothetical protein
MESQIPLNYPEMQTSFNIVKLYTAQKDFLQAIMQGRTDYERSALPLCLQRTCCQ